MATEVSSMFGNESKSEKPDNLVTRDLLGESSSIEIKELDLDLHVPSGWEKRLDLKSGKVYIQRYSSLGSPSMSEHNQMNQASPNLQDVNFPPSSSKMPLNLFEETNLDLKLVSSSLPSSNYQSVCTLDKVKSALERAEKEPIRKRASPSYPSSYSVKETQEEESEEKLCSLPMAAGCPSCLSYVLIMKNNPKCPRCDSVVPFPLVKKPKIDLNMTI